MNFKSKNKSRKRFWILVNTALWLVFGSPYVVGMVDNPPLGAVQFVDVTEELGIDFVHHDGSCGAQYLVELMGAGLAVLDFDRDGWLDIYFTNGADLPGCASSQSPTNSLWRNTGKGGFCNVSQPSLANDAGYGLSVTVGDFDNDGFPDIFLGNFHSQVLLRNCGDGTFLDITKVSGLERSDRFAAGCCFLDVDGDGLLDLFVGSYVDFSFERHRQIAPGMFPYPPGPKDYPFMPSSLYLNRGDGVFVDASESSGIAAVKAPCMGCVAGDFDGDGDVDIYVACDTTPGLFFENDGTGRFKESGISRGAAFGNDGNPVGGMGVEAGDLDNDCWEDIVVTDYTAQKPLLFRNLGEGLFEERGQVSRIARPLLPHTNWGVAFFDANLNGFRDIFIANGHLLKNVETIESITRYKLPNSLFLNDGRGRFEDVSAKSGAGFQVEESTRGCAVADFDRDGDIDIVVLNCDAPATYLRNELDSQNHWLSLDLVGIETNRDAIGAKVIVHTGGKRQFAEVRSGRGYQSDQGQRLHFGLGAYETVDQLEIQWSPNLRTSWMNLPVDRCLLIIENQETPLIREWK